MPIVLLLMLVLAAAAVVYGLSRPLPQSVAVGARVLLLTICATVAHAVFREVRSDNTVMLAAIVMLIGGWIATLSSGRIAKPGVEYGSAWIVPTVPDRNSMVVAFACAAVLMTIVLLQQTSAMVGLSAQRSDLSSLIVFTICLASWSVIVASNIAPWRLHRRWTLPTTVVVVAAMAVLMPVAWWMSDGDGAGLAQQPYQQQSFPRGPSNTYDSGSYGGGMNGAVGGGDPFAHASNAASSARTTFAASASIIASNMLAIAGFLFLMLRIGMARWARFDDDGSPMPGEVSKSEKAGSAAGPARFAGEE